MLEKLTTTLAAILEQYRISFSDKVYSDENNESDPLMEVFGISPELKRENRQYWGRELGMCWQRLVIEICKETLEDYGPALRFGADEPCDLVVGKLAIDTKYRIGSGDSGTLKKLKMYAKLLKENGYEPWLLIVREDNLPGAMAACREWNVVSGDATFAFVSELTGFDVRTYLQAKALEYKVTR